ncbi:MAG: metallophosphoesterase, partial [Kiritimatiellae bacterium]|nr:metallophosphoesterase [Kiritimatiellia bacterium]
PGRTSSAMTSVDLLILSDLHYVGPQTPLAGNGTRRVRLGLELAVRAVRDALRTGRPDAICLLGDIVEDGNAPGAMYDLGEVALALTKFGIPLLAVPGNHDRVSEQVAKIFNCPSGLHHVGSYDCIIFHDRYDEHDVCTRPLDQMQVPTGRDANRPLFVLQHNPVLPRIENSYPYTIKNAEAIAEEYERGAVFLSISGHYHAGLSPLTSGKTTYVVCPALCEYPFRYTRLRIEGRRVVAARQIPLAPPELADLFDVHLHTEFAHCATDTTIAGVLERANEFKLGGVGLCEHADQLYFPAENFWTRTDVNETHAMRTAVAAGHYRHGEYRGIVRAIRDRNHLVRLGLEVEHEESGCGLAILSEDIAGYDYLLGSIHYLTRGDDRHLSAADAEREFLRRVKQLVCAGINVLGHPFRYFPRHERPVPENLFRPVADLLAAHHVAAEINFHGDQPSEEFLALCISRGVQLAVGTDAHSLVEVCELRPHLDILRSLGVWERRSSVLWRPTTKIPSDLR